MAIVLEGFDNSGKSTLAASLGLDVYHPGPRPVNYRVEQDCFKVQQSQARLPMVMDRVTCISNACYQNIQHSRYSDARKNLINTPHCVIVYCRPDISVMKDFSHHMAKSYDDEKRIKWLYDHAEEIIHRYDMLMATLPHKVFDWKNPNMGILQEAFDALFCIGTWKSWSNPQ